MQILLFECTDPMLIVIWRDQSARIRHLLPTLPYTRNDHSSKDALLRVDYQYRSLKDSIEQWSKKEDRLGYAVDQLGIEGEENEENLKQLMDELRAD